jgi:hypothetical protein
MCLELISIYYELFKFETATPNKSAHNKQEESGQNRGAL